MSPSPLTPISEESLPNYPEMKVQKEVNSHPTKDKEDRGCLYYYDRPEAKGSFQGDTFFKNAQMNYENAVQDIMNRRGSHDRATSDGSPNMSEYRHLRQSDTTKQDTQASGLTDIGSQYQIVLDVTSYSPSDITVKAVGDQELLVEGKRVETRQDGTSVNQSFSRRFCLPGLVQLDAVTSALSSDGVLTITAPKRSSPANNTSNLSQQQLKPDNVHPFLNPRVHDDISKTQGTQKSIFNEKDNSYKEELGNFLNDIDLENRMKYQVGFSEGLNSMPMPSEERKMSASSDVVEEDQQFKITLDVIGYNPRDISVKAVGDRELLVEGKHVDKTETGSETSKSFSRRFCLPELVKLDAVRSSLSTEGALTITAPKMVVNNNIPKLQNQEEKQQTSNSSNVFLNNTAEFPSAVSDNTFQFHNNSIDDFFGKDFDMSSNINYRKPSLFMEKARSDYNDSIKNMMNRNWVMEAEVPQFFSTPSTLSAMENNSAKSMSDIIESAEDYKMKLDVRQYRPENITVKSVGERELLIEGKHGEGKQPGAGPAISHSFSRRFCLPGVARMEAVTSSLGKDGTLTITAPKMIIEN